MFVIIWIVEVTDSSISYVPKYKGKTNCELQQAKKKPNDPPKKQHKQTNKTTTQHHRKQYNKNKTIPTLIF